MNSLYVVRRPFKAHGNLFEAGTIIDDPASIKLFRSRLGNRDIVQLIEGSDKNQLWYDYLSTRVQTPMNDRILKICGKLPVETPKVVTPVTPVKAVTPTVAPAKAATTTATKSAVTTKPVATKSVEKA